MSHATDWFEQIIKDIDFSNAKGHCTVFFDIDGTLLRTYGAGERAMSLAARKLFGDTFSFDGVRFSGNLDPNIFSDAARRSQISISEQDHLAFRELYFENLDIELKRPADERPEDEKPPEQLEGVSELLTALRTVQTHTKRYAHCLLTGNYTQGAPIKLRHVGIDPDQFDYGIFGDTPKTMGKSEYTRRDLADAGVKQAKAHQPAFQPHQAIVIGDTPHDIDCALTHGATAIGVATGRFSTQELDHAGAHHSFVDLSNPRPVLELVIEKLMKD